MTTKIAMLRIAVVRVTDKSSSMQPHVCGRVTTSKVSVVCDRHKVFDQCSAPTFGTASDAKWLYSEEPLVQLGSEQYTKGLQPVSSAV